MPVNLSAMLGKSATHPPKPARGRPIETRLYDDVAFMTGLIPHRNHLNTESLEKVVRRVRKTFERAGLQVILQTWVAGGRTYTNVVGVYNPNGKQTLVVGAHYDVCGDQPGADDNASAVAGLLELARRVGRDRPTLPYRVEFVAYCLEEPPYFGSQQMGSYIHAKSLSDGGVDVIGMICLEMIGYFDDRPGSQIKPSNSTGDGRIDGIEHIGDVGDFIAVVGIREHDAFNARIHALMSDDAGIDVHRVEFSHGLGLASMSDQRSYWPFGFPALMINDTSFLRNPHYHQDTDTIDTLNFEKMAHVVEAVHKAVVGWN